ncbi:MAG TPA: F0F1 ATP synthase subunit A [Candidatus Acidoferrales bacterium]|nr:F0F1 ATP synthase subunit A [Candidatus Acidoferrales bacterium]
MEHPLWITVILNKLFGGAALALLAALHIQPASREYPIPNHVSMEVLVFALSVVFFLWLKGRISADRPGATQQVMEMLLTNPMDVGIRDLVRQNIHDGDRYVPMIGTIGIFILICNLISLIPTLQSPTADKSVPLGCATIVFIYYNYCGFAKHGPFGYAKHFLGPEMPMPGIVKWVLGVGLMLPIELFSHSFRLLSLTVRLWVNMMVSEILYVIFLGLMLDVFLLLGKLSSVGYVSAILPLGVPLAFIGLHIFVGILQAFVFTILPVVYVAGAVAEQH